MLRRCRVSLSLAVLLLSPVPARAFTNLTRLDLKPVVTNVGRLFSASSEAIKVVVRDERAIPWLLASHSGKSGPYKLYQGYYVENPGAVADLVEAGAREAVEIVGMTAAEGGPVLEITIKDFRIEMAPPQFGLPNYISYGELQATLKASDGTELAAGSYRVASWDTSSRIDVIPATYLKAAWEATARTLLGHYPRKPEPEAIRRILGSTNTNPDEYQRSYAIFWLGLVARGDAAVGEKLLALFREHHDQTTYEAAAMALARLAAPGTREEFEGVLSGSKKLKEWDPRDDAEEAFTLLHALAILGATDLGAKVPPTIKRHRDKLPVLLRFHETGEIPKPSAKELEELGQKHEKLQAKRKG